jgi:O-antigen/teichoic acid export membrane protein
MTAQAGAIAPSAGVRDSGRERYRRAGLAAGASAVSRLLTIGVSLAAVPILLNAVGTERYGLWATIAALTSMLVFADFGLGNGLVTAIAASRARDDEQSVASYISSGFFMLAAIAVVLGVGFALVFQLVPWAQLFNVAGSTAVGEAGPTIAVFLACFLATLPLTVASRVQLGDQEAYITAIWTGIGAIGSLVALVALASAGASLPVLVLALSGIPVLALGLNSAVEFGFRKRSLVPRRSLVSRPAASRLLRLGFLYFVLQLAVAIGYQSDVIVAARLTGPDGAAQYAVVFRLFMVVPTLLALLLTPLWPAYTDAIERGDHAWVTRTLKRTVLGSAAIALAAVAAVFVGSRLLLDIWVGSAFDPAPAFLSGMAVWAVLASAFNAVAMLFNGAAVVRFQLVVATAMAITSVCLSVVLGARFGLAGIIWGTVIAYVVVSAVPQVLYLPRLLRSLGQRSVMAEAVR